MNQIEIALRTIIDRQTQIYRKTLVFC